MPHRPTTQMRSLLKKPGVVLGPGVIDPFTARLAAEAGFDMVYMGGNATTAVRLGTPDVGLLTIGEMADHAGRIADAVELPLVVDGDNGYGNALNVRRAIQMYERANVAGIHFEDQASPKKCGHFAGKVLVSKEEMASKIKAAVDARTDEDFLVIARTDAVPVDGFEAAYERLQSFKEAGADMVMLPPPITLEQVAKVKEIGLPQVAVLDSSGKTPVVPPADLEEAGVKLAIFPTAVVMAIIPAVRNLYKAIKEDGHLGGTMDALAPYGDYNDILGLPAVQELEQKYALER
ncbi:MAG: isocitrate lyase/PEP mutase family protein [Rhodospirillales bacterium]|jgi:2-methylisocitrate lyase-like PEP mutase family enzyme